MFPVSVNVPDKIHGFVQFGGAPMGPILPVLLPSPKPAYVPFPTWHPDIFSRGNAKKVMQPLRKNVSPEASGHLPTCGDPIP